MYIYFQLGNLDPALRSRLESINLIALFHHEELSSYSLDEQLPQDLMHLLFEGLFPFHIRVPLFGPSSWSYPTVSATVAFL